MAWFPPLSLWPNDFCMTSRRFWGVGVLSHQACSPQLSKWHHGKGIASSGGDPIGQKTVHPNQLQDFMLKRLLNPPS
jgi:hypothetical protein